MNKKSWMVYIMWCVVALGSPTEPVTNTVSQKYNMSHPDMELWNWSGTYGGNFSRGGAFQDIVFRSDVTLVGLDRYTNFVRGGVLIRTNMVDLDRRGGPSPRGGQGWMTIAWNWAYTAPEWMAGRRTNYNGTDMTAGPAPLTNGLLVVYGAFKVELLSVA
jgi:hypothetical protein